MRDLVRKYVDAGREAVGGDRAEELARDFLDWSRRSAERLAGLVRREVQRQLRLAGAATRDEIAELRKRVRALERQMAGQTSAKESTAKKPSARKSTAKRSSAKRSTAKGSTGKASGSTSASRTPPG